MPMKKPAKRQKMISAIKGPKKNIEVRQKHSISSLMLEIPDLKHLLHMY
jgi:hypothetical protein